MKKKILAIILSTVMTASCFNVLGAGAVENISTTSLATGLIPESLDDIKEKLNVTDDVQNMVASSAINMDSLPSSCDNSESQYFPDIGNQGGINTCVGWATTYYQYTYELNKYKNVATTSSNTYSPSWTYNYASGGTIVGITFSAAYEILYNQGALKLVDYPYNIENYSFDMSTDEEKMIDALQYRAKRDIVEATSSSNISEVKSMLANGHIATAGISSMAWKGARNADGEYCVVYAKDGNIDHAVTIVGYDDNFQVTYNGITFTGAFKVANSYGKNWSGGKDGCFWVAYDALNSVSTYGSGWENSSRYPVFLSSGSSGDTNAFYFMEIVECDVKFVGRIDFVSYDPWDLVITAGIYGKPATEVLNKRHVNSTASSSNDHFLIFDYYSIDGTYTSSDILSGRFDIYVERDATINATQIYAHVLDDLGNPITSVIALEDLTGTQGFMSTSTSRRIRLNKGRITTYAYANPTQDDADLLMRYILGQGTFSNLQYFLADMNEDGVVTTVDLVKLNQKIAELNGTTYQITDYIDSWGCSLADIIEEEFDMPIEEYIAENYAELASINAIPTDLRSDTYVS